MGLLNYFGSKRLKDKAALLISDFALACPPAKVGAPVVSEAKVNRALEDLYRDAAAYVESERLGLLRRAQFAKVCQDELARRGYRGDLITKITTALATTALIQSPKPRS